jgi:hypothetical protein
MVEKLETVDFYSGHRGTLEYLGTLWVEDGSPEGLDATELFTGIGMAPADGEQYVERHFRAAFQELQQDWESTRKWPHDKPSSLTTDWTYRFDHGSVTVYRKGYQYMTFLCNGARQPYQYFPDMLAQAAAG